MPHLPRSNGWLLVLGALVVGAAVVPATTVRARSLGFEDRVGAQRAIERVYYSHQLGARRSFEEAVRQDILEAKVRTYLRETVALRTFWGVTVTDDMLRAELKRMSLQSRMPGRLRELYGALDHDPTLLLECLARPALVDRLSRSFFSYDRAIHADSRRDADEVREQLIARRVDPLADRKERQIVHLTRGGPGEGSNPEGPARGGTRWILEAGLFDRWLARVPARDNEIGPVEEE